MPLTVGKPYVVTRGWWLLFDDKPGKAAGVVSWGQPSPRRGVALAKKVLTVPHLVTTNPFMLSAGQVITVTESEMNGKIELALVLTGEHCGWIVVTPDYSDAFRPLSVED